MTTSLATAIFALTFSTQLPTASGLEPQAPSTTGTTDLTSGRLVWTHVPGDPFGGGMLSDRGGLVFGFHTDDELVLLSSFDADPPLPVWIAPNAVGISGFAVASESDVFLFAAVRRDWPVSTLSNLKLYRSRSTVPEWRYSFPEQGNSQPRFDLSNDGRTIVSVFEDDASGTNLLRVHDFATGVPIRTIVNADGASPFTLDVSCDGSVAGFSGAGGCRVYDLETGRLILSSPGYLAFRQALSERGRVLATAHFSSNGSQLLVRVRHRGSYRTAFEILEPPPLQLRAFAISDDGSTLVTTWWEAGSAPRAIVRAFDVPTGAMTMEHVDVAPAGTIVPGDVAVSADGSRFVVGLWGEGSGAAPELALYSKFRGAPLAVHADGGPVNSVEISPDGKRYLANRIDEALGRVVIELYESGGEDLVVRGAPRVGSTIAFELHGAPGSRAALLRSFALASEPLVLPRIGTLHLDKTTISSTPMGIVPPSGVATYSTVASTVPGMIGRTLWFQGITSRPRRLTTDFVQLTVVP